MPRGPEPDTQLLRHFSEITASSNDQSDDLALAKVLQEQEQMFLRLRGSLLRGQSQASRDPETGDQDAASISSMDSPANSMLNRFQALQSSTASGSIASDADPGASPHSSGDEQYDDMEFARRLQEEEDRAHYAHMLQMAGMGNAEEDAEYLSDDSVDPDDMTYEQLQALGDTVGVVSRGAAHDIMEQLSKTTYAQHRPEPSQQSDSDQCIVCCMEFEAHDEVCVLDCTHCYHTDCIAQWLKHSKECPICHKEVMPAVAAASNTASKPASAKRPSRKVSAVAKA